jgi:hypothetical protein
MKETLQLTETFDKSEFGSIMIIAPKFKDTVMVALTSQSGKTIRSLIEIDDHTILPMFDFKNESGPFKISFFEPFSENVLSFGHGDFEYDSAILNVEGDGKEQGYGVLEINLSNNEQ